MIGRILNSRYELQQLIGTGGMADVYRATDNLLGRTVAVKILHPQFAKDPVFIERFRQEAQAAANLNQPNIVNVFDWGIEDSTYYIIMEYVQGHDLKSIIMQGGPLLPERAVEIAMAICLALDAAHSHGVIHRDIKPQNVIVTGDNQIKVMDFGIARTAGGSAMTQTGTIMGTAQYISPEQAQGRPADPRSDLYSLGVVLYEMLTGKVPFNGENPVAVAYKQVREDPLAPSLINPDISAELEAVVMKALAKNPENRYQSALEMRSDLERCLEGAPVYATPVLPPGDADAGQTQAYRMAAPATHGGRSAWIWVLVSLILLTGIGLGIWAILMNTGGIRVPDVVGMKRTDAEAQLVQLGLKMKVAGEEMNAGQPKDTVLTQDPTRDSKLAKGGTVSVTISLGPELVTVPNVVGMGRDQGASAVEAAGLKVGEVTEAFSSQPRGRIASQDPKAETRVPKDSAVNFVLSRGPEMTVVPRVTGMTSEQATEQLKNSGLEAEIQAVFSTTEPENLVKTQNPAAGESIAKGSKVTLQVTRRPEQKQMPNVVGMTRETAISTLSAAGFTGSPVIENRNVPPGSSDDGKVLDQNPKAGTQTYVTESVTLVVGKAPGP